MSVATAAPMTPSGAVAVRLQAALSRARATGRPVLVSLTRRVALADPLAYYARALAAGEQAFYWDQPAQGRAFAAVGAAHVILCDGAGDGRDASRRWRDLLSGAEIEVVGDAWGEAGPAGPVLVGGFAFDPAAGRAPAWAHFPPGALWLPHATLTTLNSVSWLTTNVLAPPEGDEAALRAALLGPHVWSSPSSYPSSSGPRRSAPADREVTRRLPSPRTPSPEGWKATVALAETEARRGRFEKVVLARAATAPAGGRLSPDVILARLRDTHPSATIFAVSPRVYEDAPRPTFLGATPEGLVALRHGEARAMCLAGSRPRGSDAAEDARLARDLHNSAKDRREHGVVRDVLLEELRDICGNAWAPPDPEVLRMANVQHLHTPVVARARPGQGVLDLVARLHPTPAVGGTPREAALAFIREHEGLDRGWYAGPVGWVDRNGDGEFAVALRSALVRPHEATLFAGCGIVAGSDPDTELRESGWKLRPMLGALGA